MKETLYVSIAGFTIRFIFAGDYNLQMEQLFVSRFRANLSEFIITAPATFDYTITVVWMEPSEEVVREKEKKKYVSIYQITGKNSLTMYYQNSMFHVQLVLRDVLYKLLMANNGFMLHASGVCKTDRAFVFTGRSGIGKSTIMKFLHSTYKAVADDAVIIRKKENRYMVYQSPLVEKESFVKKSPRSITLMGCYFIKQAEKVSMNKMQSAPVILRALAKQVYAEGRDLAEITTILAEFIQSEDIFYTLSFPNRKDEVVAYFVDKTR